MPSRGVVVTIRGLIKALAPNKSANFNLKLIQNFIIVMQIIQNLLVLMDLMCHVDVGTIHVIINY